MAISYQKRTWNTGEVITRESMNRIENQLAILTNYIDQARKSSLFGDQKDPKARMDRMENEMQDYIKKFRVNDGYLVPINGRDEEQDPLGPFAGSGGGSGGGGSGGTNNVTTSLNNISGWGSKYVAQGENVPLLINWISVEDVGGGNVSDTGTGMLQIKLNNSLVDEIDIEQGENTINLTNYLRSGRNAFVLTSFDQYGNWKTIRVTVIMVDLSISSNYVQSTINAGDASVSTQVLGTDDVDDVKVRYYINDVEVTGSPATVYDSDPFNFIVPHYPSGTYTLKMKAEATIPLTGRTIYSRELSYKVIFTDSNSVTPIISITVPTLEYDLYSTIPVKYQVYTPDSVYSDVNIYLKEPGDEDYSLASSLTNVSSDEQTYSYRALKSGRTYIKISTGEEGTNTYAEEVIYLQIRESNVNVTAVTDDLLLYFTAQGHSNHDANPATWTSDVNSRVINAQLTNFDFIDGGANGWQIDNNVNNATVLRVAGNARVSIPYNIFAGTDFKAKGKTIEIEFSTRNVMNYDSPIISSWEVTAGHSTDEGHGIRITPQKATFRSQTVEIFTQYKEGEQVRVSFVVQPNDETGKRLVYCYINGILSGAETYVISENNEFLQNSALPLTIGSNDCVTDIYCIRVYDKALGREQILNNWIADTQNGQTLIDRYTRNNIFSTIAGRRTIDIDKIPNDVPRLIFYSRDVDLPQYKGDKKYVSGRMEFRTKALENRSFEFENLQIDVQGTSSQYYARKNYKIKTIKPGKDKNDPELHTTFTMHDGTVYDYSKVTLQNGTEKTMTPKFTVMEDSLPIACVCLKADVASSEGANNVELAMEYNDTCPYKTPGQIANPKAKQGIEGFPIVVFRQDTAESNVSYFIGKYNFNVDKSSENHFALGYEADDESWEFLNNTSDRVLFNITNIPGENQLNKKGELVPGWTLDFEARYPDEDPPYGEGREVGGVTVTAAEEYDQLKTFIDWVVSTNVNYADDNRALPEPVTYRVKTKQYAEREVIKVDQETGNSYIAIEPYETEVITNVEFTHDTREYRLAKFKNELGNYVEIDSALFYYVFTETFLLMDNRAKNMFLSFIGSRVTQ